MSSWASQLHAQCLIDIELILEQFRKCITISRQCEVSSFCYVWIWNSHMHIFNLWENLMLLWRSRMTTPLVPWISQVHPTTSRMTYALWLDTILAWLPPNWLNWIFNPLHIHLVALVELWQLYRPLLTYSVLPLRSNIHGYLCTWQRTHTWKGYAQLH